MGLTDRFNDLKAKAGEAVAEHNEQIQSAVEKAASAADKHTGGKYSDRIEQAGAKAGSLVDSLNPTDEPGTAGDDEDAAASE